MKAFHFKFVVEVTNYSGTTLTGTLKGNDSDPLLVFMNKFHDLEDKLSELELEDKIVSDSLKSKNNGKKSIS